MTRWLLLGLAVLLFFQFGMPLLTGKTEVELQPLDVKDESALSDAHRSDERICDIAGPRFKAELSSRGGSLRHFWLEGDKYLTTAPDAQEQSIWRTIFGGPATRDRPIDLVTTNREGRSPLRTDLRLPPSAGDAAQQVAFDDVDWKLAASDGTSCTFTYADDKGPNGEPQEPTVELTKRVAATDKPYELRVTVDVKNVGEQARKHRLAIEQTAYHTEKKMESHLGQMSEHLSEVLTSTTEGVERLAPTDFDPSSFKDPEFTAERWRRSPGEGKWVATSSSYFTAAIVHLDAPAVPSAEAQVEYVWDRPTADDPTGYVKMTDDPNHGYVYRSRLAYPERELAPGQAVTYTSLAFVGPKERDILAEAGDGNLGISEVINLGWFSFIGKYLVAYVYVLHGLVNSWGWAIVLLTITVKLLLFPLSLTQIKSGIAMRRLKPEMDEINAKYKDDMTQRGLATQELWRKHKVSSPVIGCIPALLQMPVWFALYAVLGTAVELYHERFGLFIPDLSAPGLYLIIPLVLGASSFLQQKLMPPQGDPQQQKMMMYMMPGIFTVMMLFLPAGLGVYMLTNTWLGIAQQVLVERFLRSRSQGPSGPGEIGVREKTPSGDAKTSADLGKGKARVHG